MLPLTVAVAAGGEALGMTIVAAGGARLVAALGPDDGHLSGTVSLPLTGSEVVFDNLAITKAATGPRPSP